MRSLTLIAMLAAALASPLSAQSPDASCPSGVVRWSVGSGHAEGTVTGALVPGQSIKVVQRGMSVARELDAGTPGLACLVNRGSKGEGALVGVGVGAVVGLMIGFASGDEPQNCLVLCSAGEKAGIMAMSIAPLGALLGGALAPGATWSPLRAGQPQARVTPLISAKGVGVRVRF